MEDNVDVGAIMDTWTLQEGFPLVTVEVRGQEVILKQERYLKGEKSSKTSRYALTYCLMHTKICIWCTVCIL